MSLNRSSDSIIDIKKDEESQLLDIPPTTPGRNWASTAASVILGGVGIGAGALYFGPAQTCAASEECGKWLSNLISEKGAVIVFTAGGFDFSAGAMFMGAQSADAMVSYIQKQTSTGAKVGKGIFVISLATTQMIPLLMTAIATSPALWETILTVGGATPGSLYGAIHLTETELPLIASKIKAMASNFYHHVLENCMQVTEAERQQMRMIKHYRAQHARFLDDIDTRWKYIVAHASSVNTTNTHDPLAFLMQEGDATPSSSWLASGVSKFGSLTGFLLAANYSSGMIHNTYNILRNYIPTLPLQIISTGLLSVSTMYGNIKLTTDGVHAILNTMVDVIRGKPINSLPYQLRPKTSALIAGASLAMSALSYAVIAVVFASEFKGDDLDPDSALAKTRLGFIYGAMAGIDIYHFASLFHLYRLLFSALTRDEKEKFIFEVEKEVTRLQNMTESEFIHFVENNNIGTNIALGLTSFADLPNEGDIQESSSTIIIRDDLSDSSDDESSMEDEPYCLPSTTNTGSSYFGNWFSWFTPANESNSPQQEPTYEPAQYGKS